MLLHTQPPLRYLISVYLAHKYNQIVSNISNKAHNFFCCFFKFILVLCLCVSCVYKVFFLCLYSETKKKKANLQHFEHGVKIMSKNIYFFETITIPHLASFDSFPTKKFNHVNLTADGFCKLRVRASNEETKNGKNIELEPPKNTFVKNTHNAK